MHFPQVIYGILPLRHFDVRMTLYKNFTVDFGFRIQKYSLHQDQTNILPISC